MQWLNESGGGWGNDPVSSAKQINFWLIYMELMKNSMVITKLNILDCKMGDKNPQIVQTFDMCSTSIVLWKLVKCCNLGTMYDDDKCLKLQLIGS
jgi:hypothetical protein